MDKKIILPNNWFGVLAMVVLILLTATLPFLIVYWLVLMIAPWWISIPLALLVEILVFFSVVKFKQ